MTKQKPMKQKPPREETQVPPACAFFRRGGGRNRDPVVCVFCGRHRHEHDAVETKLPVPINSPVAVERMLQAVPCPTCNAGKEGPCLLCNSEGVHPGARMAMGELWFLQQELDEVGIGWEDEAGIDRIEKWLFNETRLYKQLGKDDARTVLAVWRRFKRALMLDWRYKGVKRLPDLRLR